jgi:hypothetical protein
MTLFHHAKLAKHKATVKALLDRRVLQASMKPLLLEPNMQEYRNVAMKSIC